MNTDTSFEPKAMRTLLESAAEKAGDKISRAKRGGQELAIFADVLLTAIDKELPFQPSLKAALQYALAKSQDSLSWIIQNLMGDLFWTYRRMASGQRRADQQAQAMASTGDGSVAEVMAALRENLNFDPEMANDVYGEETEVTLMEVEDALVSLHEALSDIYIMLPDSQFERVPYATQTGRSPAFTIDAAMELAEEIIADGNRTRRMAERSVLA